VPELPFIAACTQAQLCLRGKQALYQYCRERDIGHKRVGKLVVATAEAQVPQLLALRGQCVTGCHYDTILPVSDTMSSGVSVSVPLCKARLPDQAVSLIAGCPSMVSALRPTPPCPTPPLLCCVCCLEGCFWRVKARGRENGVEGLRVVSGAEAEGMEPQVRCVRALHSASTGIVDSHSLMAALQVSLSSGRKHESVIFTEKEHKKRKEKQYCVRLRKVRAEPAIKDCKSSWLHLIFMP